MSELFDVAVIGGGVIGLSAALALSQRGYSVTLIDGASLAVDLSRIDKRVYAINASSEALFSKLGVWQHLDLDRISPYQKMHVWDAQSTGHIDFDARMICTSKLGNIIEENVLKAALLKSIENTNIELVADAPIVDIQVAPTHITVQLEQKTVDAQYLIIADGANSTARQLLHIPLNQKSYEQQAIVATVESDQSHQQTAYQVFLPKGPLAFLPLIHPQQSSIVWSTTPSDATMLLNLDNETFNKTLTEAFTHKLGDTRVISQRFAFPLIMRHVQQYVGERWLLMGDAAHTIHPLAGLGLNLGLEDLTVWLCMLDVSSSKIWSKKMLSHYQRQRKFNVWKTIRSLDLLKNIFVPANPSLIKIRESGLNLINKCPPIKRWFIEQAQ